MLGDSLEKTFQKNLHNFTTKDIFTIAIQAITRIESLHEIKIIHRDIKPENFLFGTENGANTLFLIDFGLAKRHMVDGQHIEFKEGKSLIGTPRYCSINAASGKEQSRRDDLESLGYILIYLLRGGKGLPWQHLNYDNRLSNKERYELQLKVKIGTSVNELCNGHPTSFKTYMNYVRNLTFTENPDYNYLKSID